MKRFFPRAVREAIGFPIGLGLLGFLVLASAGCAPKQDVKPGAPVISTLSIVEPSGNRVDLTAAAKACAGFDPTMRDGGAVAGGPAASVKEGGDCDPAADGACTLDGNACQCVAKDMCDPSIDAANPTTSGTLNCTFAPLSTVIATFDRILDTEPFTGKDSMGKPIAVAAIIGTMTTDPAAGKDLVLNGEYTSSGSSTGLVFPMFFGINGPVIKYEPAPGFPTSSTVTTTLDGTVARAKDGKTPFAASGALEGGKIQFKTGSISEPSITVPAPPAMMASGGGSMMMGCPMPMTDAGGSDAVATSGPDGGADAATGDAATSDAKDAATADAAATEVGDAAVTDAAATEVAAVTDAAVVDAGASDAAKDAASEVAVTDATASEVTAMTDAAASEVAAATDAAVAPAPSTDVPASMNMAAITIAFNSVVGKDVLAHIKMTEDGLPFTAFAGPADDAFPMASVAITPTTAWAAGKTYVITIDADVADVFGKKFGTDAQSATFTMSKS